MELEGASTEDRGYLLGVMHSTEGQPFSEYNLSTDRDTILSYYFNNGYPQAQFDWSQTEVAPQRVSLRLLVTPGPRRFVRDVIVQRVSNDERQPHPETDHDRPGRSSLANRYC